MTEGLQMKYMRIWLMALKNVIMQSQSDQRGNGFTKKMPSFTDVVQTVDLKQYFMKLMFLDMIFALTVAHD